MAGLVVLGIGNALLGDDGLGVHAIGALRETPGLPDRVRLVDGGTGGLSLLPVVAGADALVLIDAVDVGAEPGSVHLLTGSGRAGSGGDMDLYASLPRLSMHQVGVADLLSAARLTGGLPDRVVLVGAQPGRLEPDLRLSPAVAAALPRVLKLVRHWCHRLAPEGSHA
jgi:hydrogenase maturation protease